MHDIAQAAGRDVAVCASRASALAMTQTRAVAARLAEFGVATTILNIATTGDLQRDRSFAAIGAESLFVKELEVALRDGRAQYAVHSCKDLPSSLPSDMAIAAISQREDARDVFCSERYDALETLPQGAVVGTSSMRRRAQLAALRPDLQFTDLRGNIDTRLRKLRDGVCDAIILAHAGLLRLDVHAAHVVPFDVEVMVPAVGQGALAIETLDGSPLARTLHEAINDPQAQLAVMCERAALAQLRGGCQAPIGIHAFHRDGELVAIGAAGTQTGAPVRRARVSGAANTLAQAREIGEQLARELSWN